MSQPVMFRVPLAAHKTYVAQALGTTLASNGMEAARRCCGGHGYSLASGLPTLFTSYVQNATWEGDNNVLYLQVGAAVLILLPFLLPSCILSGVIASPCMLLGPCAPALPA